MEKFTTDEAIDKLAVSELANHVRLVQMNSHLLTTVEALLLGSLEFEVYKEIARAKLEAESHKPK